MPIRRCCLAIAKIQQQESAKDDGEEKLAKPLFIVDEEKAEAKQQQQKKPAATGNSQHQLQTCILVAKCCPPRRRHHRRGPASAALMRLRCVRVLPLSCLKRKSGAVDNEMPEKEQNKQNLDLELSTKEKNGEANKLQMMQGIVLALKGKQGKYQQFW